MEGRRSRGVARAFAQPSLKCARKWAARAGRGKLEPRYPVLVHDYAHVKGETARIFDRTFRVTDVLGCMAGGAALCGLAGARFLPVYGPGSRNTASSLPFGMSGIQTALWVAFEGSIIAVVAAMLASAVEKARCILLAYVIQYRSFGWSIPMHVQTRLRGDALSWSLIAAVLAAIIRSTACTRPPGAEPAAGVNRIQTKAL